AIELDAERDVRRLECLAIDVGEDEEAVSPLQSLECLSCVPEGWPIADRRAEACSLLVGAIHLPLRGHPSHGRRQHLRVRHRRSLSLLCGLLSSKYGKQLLTRWPVPNARQPGVKRSSNPGFPIDECAVAIERQRVELWSRGHVWRDGLTAWLRVYSKRGL